MTTVVITGANRGLGLALAKHYIAQGSTVIGGCRTPATAHELNEAGAEVYQLDTSSGTSIASFGVILGNREWPQTWTCVWRLRTRIGSRGSKR